jgi:hypothetical protein
MRTVLKSDIEEINKLFNESDVYHISSFPWEVSDREVTLNSSHPNTLRKNWMHDKLGFYNSIISYSTLFKRINEYFELGDYCKTLRQRMNITQELFECNFKSNLPVHISYAPHESNTKMNLWDKSTFDNGHFIIHPGQTRAQGSVFTRTNLKNVLFYVNKKHSNSVHIPTDRPITKIENVKQLLEYYTPLDEIPMEHYIYSFREMTSPSNNNGLKEHGATDTRILKCWDIRNILTNRESHHASTKYVQKSLETMNGFYTIYSNNTYNVYSNTKFNTRWEMTRNTLYSNANALANENVGPLKVGISTNVQTIDSFSRVLHEDIDNTINQIQSTIKSLKSTDIKFITNYLEFLHENSEYITNMVKMEHTLHPHPIFKFIVFENGVKFDEIVRENDYRGFCLYVDSSVVFSTDRDPFEFLFCINHTVAMTRSEDGKVAIINCEHEYWKTGENYKEWILPESFYTP